jgi:hypothetical protein
VNPAFIILRERFIMKKEEGRMIADVSPWRRGPPGVLSKKPIKKGRPITLHPGSFKNDGENTYFTGLIVLI